MNFSTGMFMTDKLQRCITVAKRLDEGNGQYIANVKNWCFKMALHTVRPRLWEFSNMLALVISLSFKLTNIRKMQCCISNEWFSPVGCAAARVWDAGVYGAVWYPFLNYFPFGFPSSIRPRRLCASLWHWRNQPVRVNKSHNSLIWETERLSNSET